MNESGDSEGRGAGGMETVEALFWAALERDPMERPAYLEDATSGRPELRRKVEALLAADTARSGDADDSLTDLVERTRALALEEAGTPETVGPYRVVRLLGSGGFGSVFLARAGPGEDDGFVAVKLLRRGLDTDHIVARFYREREILTGLEHPNIARLLDAGVSEDGRPFLVMDYVDGVPMTEYCRSQELSLRARLELFRQITRAVSHAHRSLVVHRDLKPGNILVETDGSPKLLDFGTAKLISAPADQTATLTATERRMLTPRYASPEQIRGGAVTTSIDVFALGVLLYEMVAGEHPFSRKGETQCELLERICITDPPRPHGMAADVVAIVSKALRKEPAERYGSVAEFDADIQRFLERRPVAARRGSWRYRAGRFFTRYRWPLTVVGAMAAMATVFIAVLVQQRHEAVLARESAEVVSDYLRSLFLDLDPFGDRTDPVTVDELLENGVEVLERREQSDAAVDRALLITMADLNGSLGRHSRAIELLERARALVPESPLETAELDAAIGSHRIALGEAEAGETSIRRAVEAFETQGETDSLRYGRAMARLGSAIRLRGDDSAAELYLEASLLLLESLDAPARLLGETRLELAAVWHSLAREAEALELAKAVEASWRSEPSISEAKVVEALEMQVVVAAESAAFAEAQSISEEILRIRQLYLDPDHPLFISSFYNLGALANMAGDSATAESYLRRTVELMKAAEGPRHPQLPSALLWLARILSDQGRGAEAIEETEASLVAGREVYGERHEFVANGLQILGEAQWLEARPKGAIRSMEDAVQIFDQLDALRLDRTLKAHGLLIHSLLDLGRHGEAWNHLHCDRVQTAIEEQPNDVRDVFWLAAEARLRWHLEKVDPEVSSPWEERDGLQAVELALVTAFTTERLLQAGRAKDARDLAETRLSEAQDAGGKLHPLWARTRLALALALRELGLYDEARDQLHLAANTLPAFADRPLLGGPSARVLQDSGVTTK